jgi:beta-aspartyl-peptidase (threonine type)
MNRKNVHLLCYKKIKILNIINNFYRSFEEKDKMKTIILVFAILFCHVDIVHGQDAHQQGPITIVVHGGAGTLKKENMTAEQESAHRKKISEAISVGYTILENDGSALDAVLYAIVILENSPLFNAGKGAVFTHDGQNELDASIMDGSSLQAGAVAGVKTVKNPILAARAVMEQSPHVMLSGSGAEDFAKTVGLELVDPAYFYTERRYKSLQRALELEKRGSGSIVDTVKFKFGTVGVVALDKNGNLAAGTSTGGTTNKKYGRIGDSPVIGAGTYADNTSCAVSCTGDGEYFIRGVVAYDIAAKVKYQEKSVQEAAQEVVHEELIQLGGRGGVICLDRDGNYAMDFNTEGMYRGVKQKGKKMEISIFK